MKWYAYFESTTTYDLINEETYRAQYVDTISYKAKVQAKQYLIMHFKGEISDAKIALTEIRETKEL